MKRVNLTSTVVGEPSELRPGDHEVSEGAKEPAGGCQRGCTSPGHW